MDFFDVSQSNSPYLSTKCVIPQKSPVRHFQWTLSENGSRRSIVVNLKSEDLCEKPTFLGPYARLAQIGRVPLEWHG